MGEEHLQNVVGSFGQVGTKHNGTVAGTLGDLCMYGLPVLLLSGKPERLLVWVWGLCASSGKNGAEANILKGKMWVMQQLCHLPC